MEMIAPLNSMKIITLKYGTGSSGDYQFGSGDFTVEAWVLFDDFPTHEDVLGSGERGYVFEEGIHWLRTGGTLKVTANTGGHGETFASFTGLEKDKWYHIAQVKEGTNLRVYVNGVRGTDTVHSSAVNPITSARPFTIGARGPWTGYGFRGYLYDVRISSVARYSGDTITVPTKKHISDQDTEFLFQPKVGNSDSDWVDLSSNNHNLEALRYVNTAIYYAVAPPPPPPLLATASTPYDPETAIHFPTTPTGWQTIHTTSDSTDFGGDNAFVAECWVYFTKKLGYEQTIFGSITSSKGWAVGNHVGKWGSYVYGYGKRTSSAPIDLNTWIHVAVVREEAGQNTLHMYADGIKVHSFDIENREGKSYPFTIGNYTNRSSWSYVPRDAYMYDVKYTKVHDKGEKKLNTLLTSTNPQNLLSPLTRQLVQIEAGKRNHFLTPPAYKAPTLDSPTRNFCVIKSVDEQ